MTAVTDAPSLAALEQRLALIACGENTRPGKTRACDSCRKKGPGYLRIAATQAWDALAAAICGTGKAPACSDCKAKALRMIAIYNGEAE
ncbi:hypothetical protein [Streptomyces sp. CL12-4]|uniref:hypothetical protein n=1 Tax=Streptomyces sp. CL12-4 TaxID=2810306 RepID=UPI001EFBF84C|nr:hypothetical protein [Streptomyces sp. CL12-4]MCG8971788.1 hypothetical protein [Streptomyces sp. CL12-4]